MSGFLDNQSTPEGAVLDGGHGRLDVLLISICLPVFRGLLQVRNAGRLIDVLLTPRPPMEESGILEDPRVTVANFKCNAVPG